MPARSHILIWRLGGEGMNLYNYNIPVGKLLADPRARALIEREFPGLLQNPMLGFVKRMPLRRILKNARGIVPQEQLSRVLRELEEL